MDIDTNVPMPRLIDVAEVCHLTSLSVARIYALITEGELRKVKIGRKTVFVEAEVRDFINRKIVASGGLPPGWIDLDAYKADMDKFIAQQRAEEAASAA